MKRVYDPPEPEVDGVRVLVDRRDPSGLLAGARPQGCTDPLGGAPGAVR